MMFAKSFTGNCSCTCPASFGTLVTKNRNTQSEAADPDHQTTLGDTVVNGQNAGNIKVPKPWSPVPKQLEKLSECWDEVKVKSCSLIVFDLETSGLRVDEAEILQISAICEQKSFDIYAYPMYEISPGASAVNKLHLVDGVLFYDGEPVDSYCLDDALNSFMEWLSSFAPPRILVGHNVRRFDCRHFYAALLQHGLVKKFCGLVVGFIDSLPLYIDVKPGMPDYKQVTLVSLLLGESYEEHNALEDVKALQKLLSCSVIPESTLLKHSFTSDSMANLCQAESVRRENIFTYTVIMNRGISKGMANKFALNGLTYCDILAAYRVGAREGVEKLLGEKVNGIVRGTENRRVIDGILEYIEKVA